MGTLENSSDPDEMQHDAAFHLGLNCLLRLKQPSGTSDFIWPYYHLIWESFPIKKNGLYFPNFMYFST